MKEAILFTIIIFFSITIKGQTMPSQPGVYKMQMTLDDGTTLLYGLSIPKKHSSQQSVPLIVALHYGGKVTPYYGHDYMKNFVAPALGNIGAIIVAPDCPQQNWKTEQSQEAILQLIVKVKSDFAIDTSRLAITGFSMGALGIWHTIAKQPHLFAAAIVVSGRVEPEELEKIPNIPIFIIHSDVDKILPYQSAKHAFDLLKNKKYSVHFKTVNGVNHYDTAGFLPALGSAANWLQRQWKKSGKGSVGKNKLLIRQ